MVGVCSVWMMPSDIQEKLGRLSNVLNITVGCVYQIAEFEFYLEGDGQLLREFEEETA